MAKILNIETASPVCSASISQKGELLDFREINEHNAHAKYLTIFIEEMMQELKLEYSDLDAVAVSEGPGSYTGLRIGVSTAKGIAYASSIPLISVSTLQATAYRAAQKYGKHDNPLFCPMIDARRNEVYAAIYDADNNEIRKTQADIVDAETYAEYLKDYRVVFVGNGAEKCRELIRHPKALFEAAIHCSSKNMPTLAYEKFLNSNFADLAYFEPFYLKKYKAAVSTKHIYG